MHLVNICTAFGLALCFATGLLVFCKPIRMNGRGSTEATFHIKKRLLEHSSIWRNVQRGHAGLFRLSRLNSLPHSRIVNPYYGETVHSRGWNMMASFTNGPYNL